MLKTAAHNIPIYVGLLQFENSPVGIIQGCGNGVRDPSLKHQANALGFQRATIKAEGPGIDIRQNVFGGPAHIANPQQSGVLDAVSKVSDLEFVLPGPLRQRNLVMMRVLQKGLTVEHGHARTGFAEGCGSRIETLAGAGVGLAGGVAIFEDGIGGQVPIGDRRSTERSGSVAQKLNVLPLAAKLKVEKVAN